MNTNKIVRGSGLTVTEKLQAKLCEKIFLGIWNYPNLYKADGKELCDVLAVFGNHVFIFSVKAKKYNYNKDPYVAWKRWKREAIDQSVDQIRGAEKYIRNNPDQIFLDAKCQEKCPLDLDKPDLKFHRFVVAHGAEEACKKYSPDNINGSLALSYERALLKNATTPSQPFMCQQTGLNLASDFYHVLDSYNLEIVLGELNTPTDLIEYLDAKKEAIQKYPEVWACGEEDFLAAYLFNFDSQRQRHFIAVPKHQPPSSLIHGGLWIPEGLWQELVKNPSYQRKKKRDEYSYGWDAMLKQMSDERLSGKLAQMHLSGEINDRADIITQFNALNVMMKEPRFIRANHVKAILDAQKAALQKLPAKKPSSSLRTLRTFRSNYPNTWYALLQVFLPSKQEPTSEEIQKSNATLCVACGVTKVRFPSADTIVGILLLRTERKDILDTSYTYLDCKKWTAEQEKIAREDARALNFPLDLKEMDNIQRYGINEFPEADEFPDDNK